MKHQTDKIQNMVCCAIQPHSFALVLFFWDIHTQRPLLLLISVPYLKLSKLF